MRSKALVLAALFVAGPVRAEAPSAFGRGPYLQALGPTSVEVRVELPAPAPVSITITPKNADAGAPRTVTDTKPSAMHVLAVGGLSPSMRYSYVVTSGPSGGAGSTSRGEFSTAPSRDSREPFSFLVYGDDRTDDVGHASVVHAMLESPSDFVINTGDLVANGGDDEDWRSFFSIEAPLLRDRCVFACVGNHELLDGAGASYLRYFGPTFDSQGEGAKPKLYGSFRWGDARFFLLDAMESFDEGPERAWLEGELDRADGETGLDWRIVVMHHGPWSAGPHAGNPRALRAGIPALLVKHHVDLVLAGHDHIYERGFASGVRYLISGGGGAPVYPVDHPLTSTRKVESARHFVEVTVQPASIGVVAKRDDGSRLDQCTFGHGRQDWDCDPPAAAPARETTTTPVAPPPAPSRCACDVVGRSRGPGSGAFAPLVTAAALALLAGVVGRRRDRG